MRPLIEPVSRSASVLVLGLGNPILGDDGVGWRVAADVQAQLGSQTPPVEVDCVSLGGLSLMERMLGYDRVILIDSIDTGASPQGSVTTYSLVDLPNPNSGHTASAHDASLVTALRTAEVMGARVPTRVQIVAIEAKSSLDFSEELTPPIARAVPNATRKVLELLQADVG